MMALTGAAKLLGMLRTARLAALFGTGTEAEALAAAGRIPNLLFDLLPAAAVSGCFIPVFGQKGTDKRGFSACFGTLFLGFLSLIALLCLLLAGPLVGVLFPGLSEEAAALTVALFTRYAVTLLPMGGSAVLTALCQVKGRYLLPPAAGLTANGLELMALYGIPSLSPRGIAELRLLSLLLQCALMAFPFRGVRHFCLTNGLSSVKEAAKRLPAALLPTWLLPISLSAAMAAASYCEGGAAAFGYASALFSAALGVTVSGVVNYSFPKLSTEQDPAARKRQTGSCLVTLLAISLPLALLLCLLAPEAVALLYRRGHFSPRDAEGVSRLLSVLALALPFCALEEFQNRLAWVSNRKTAAILPMLLGVGSAFLLSAFLRPLGLAGGAMAFLVSHALAALVQGYCLRRELPTGVLRVLPAILMGLAALCLVYWSADSLASSLRWDRNLLLPFSVAPLGGVLYLTVCRVTLGRERSDPLP